MSYSLYNCNDCDNTDEYRYEFAYEHAERKRELELEQLLEFIDKSEYKKREFTLERERVYELERELTLEHERLYELDQERDRNHERELERERELEYERELERELALEYERELKHERELARERKLDRERERLYELKCYDTIGRNLKHSIKYDINDYNVGSDSELTIGFLNKCNEIKNSIDQKEYHCYHVNNSLDKPGFKDLEFSKVSLHKYIKQGRNGEKGRRTRVYYKKKIAKERRSCSKVSREFLTACI
jgi:hypothetical protein